MSSRSRCSIACCVSLLSLRVYGCCWNGVIRPLSLGVGVIVVAVLAVSKKSPQTRSRMWPVVCTVDRDIVLQLLSSCDVYDCERFTVFVLPYSGCKWWCCCCGADNCCDCFGICRCNCGRCWFWMVEFCVVVVVFRMTSRFCCAFPISGMPWTVNSISLRMSSSSWWRSKHEKKTRNTKKWNRKNEITCSLQCMRLRLISFFSFFFVVRSRCLPSNERDKIVRIYHFDAIKILETVKIYIQACANIAQHNRLIKTLHIWSFEWWKNEVACSSDRKKLIKWRERKRLLKCADGKRWYFPKDHTSIT